MLKRLAVLAVITAAVAIALTPGVAMANYSIHGSYEMDTEACAGCHRAHTAPSSITWTGSPVGETDFGSALLISDATENFEFCYACHDSVSLGADTNVEAGIYEGDLFDNLPGGMLNGGGFEEDFGFTSQHSYMGGQWPVYGGATEPTSALFTLKDGPLVEMTCSSCHDVHGSSNYRLLKDTLPALQRPGAVAVGGYNAADTPFPWVISAETGYPVGGWLLHEAGAAQVALYEPSYTTPRYAKAPGEDPNKGMSGWCAGCHIQYMNPTGAEVAPYGDTYDGTPNPAEPGSDFAGSVVTSMPYETYDIFGNVVRHRHPINVELNNYDLHHGTTDALSWTVADTIPLAHDLTGLVTAGRVNAGAAAVETENEWIECLTCHRAHGSNATMENEAEVGNIALDNADLYAVETGSNALLRDNNRAVCEKCHNK